MSFLHQARVVLGMIYRWRDLRIAYDDLVYDRSKPSPDGIEVGDYVKKITGDYHIYGFVVAVFRTKARKQLRCVVEIRAEGGGYFLHIFAPHNLEIIRKTDEREPPLEPISSAPPRAGSPPPLHK